MESRCNVNGCGSRILNRWVACVIAYVTAGLALSVPFLNSIGAEVRNLAEITAMNISFMSIIIAAVWFLTGVVSSTERHDNSVMCVIHSCGIPGILIALLGIAL